MYRAISVAHYIVEYCNSIGRGISNLKLQKILYFVQAEFLVSTADNSPCFSDAIEAWDFGPVVPNVYRQYKIYGSAMIPSNPNDEFLDFYESIKPEHKKMIESIVDEAANLTAYDLVQITHNQTPWKVAYRKGWNREITNQSLLNYFKE